MYDDGGEHCFVCSAHSGKTEGSTYSPPKGQASENFTPIASVFHPYRSRSIGRDAVRRYGVDVNQDENSDIEARYPVYRGGVHVGNKVRRTGKRFYYEGSVREGLDLFGQQTFPAGSAKAITIVEGQDDALAAFELTGLQFPCVSVHGAASAVDDCKRNYEYLNSFDTIVINFDRDEEKVNPRTGEKTFPGQEAALKVAGLFKPGKVKILTLREYKDANDYLINGRAKQYVKEWWGAPAYHPDGIKLGTQM